MKTSNGVPIWEEQSIDVFFATIFSRDGISVNKISDAIDKLGENKYEQEFAIPLAALHNELSALYEEKHKKKGEDASVLDPIREEIDENKLEVLQLFREMGLSPKSTRKNGKQQSRKNKKPNRRKRKQK